MEVFRDIDSRITASYPETFDIIKVLTTGTSAAGTIVYKDAIFIVVAKGANSVLPTPTSPSRSNLG